MFSSRRKFIKFIKLLLATVICSFFISSLLFALIHTILTVNIYAIIFGLIFLIPSIVAYFYNEKIEIIERFEAIENRQKKVESTAHIKIDKGGGNYPTNIRIDSDGHDFIEPIVETINTTTINTGGGNNNGRIQGDYAERDLNKNVTINKKRVEISSDISQILGDFKDILNEMMDKNPHPVDVISQFARELTEELRKQPEVKVSLSAEEDSSDEELANKIIIDLLTKSYDEISQMNQVIQTSLTGTNPVNKIQKNTNHSALEYTYYTVNENEYNNDRHIIIYNEYTIHLAKDHEDMWHLDIKREDDSSLNLSKQRRFSSKDNAIGTAKKKIDKDRIASWKNNINTPE